MDENFTQTVRRIDLLTLMEVASHCMHRHDIAVSEATKLILEKLEANWKVRLFFCVPQMEIEELPILGPKPIVLNSPSNSEGTKIDPVLTALINTSYVLSRDVALQSVQRAWRVRDDGTVWLQGGSAPQGIAMLQVEAIQLFELATSQARPFTTPPPLPRQRAQEAAILAKLADLGIDPQALPVTQPGKRTVKQDVRVALHYSHDVMNKAWSRLRTEKSIRDTLP